MRPRRRFRSIFPKRSRISQTHDSGECFAFFHNTNSRIYHNSAQAHESVFSILQKTQLENSKKSPNLESLRISPKPLNVSSRHVALKHSEDLLKADLSSSFSNRISLESLSLSLRTATHEWSRLRTGTITTLSDLNGTDACAELARKTRALVSTPCEFLNARFKYARKDTELENPTPKALI